MRAMKKGRWLLFLLLLAVFSLTILRKLPDFQKTENRKENPKGGKNTPSENGGTGKNTAPSENSGGLHRDISRIIYTRHAKCRMDCRMIDVSEVEEILQKGEINYQKSDLRGSPDPKYALEGNTHDGQHVRIVFAESARGPVVVTVIDLEKEWQCNCN